MLLFNSKNMYSLKYDDLILNRLNITKNQKYPVSKENAMWQRYQTASLNNVFLRRLYYGGRQIDNLFCIPFFYYTVVIRNEKVF